MIEQKIYCEEHPKREAAWVCQNCGATYCCGCHADYEECIYCDPSLIPLKNKFQLCIFKECEEGGIPKTTDINCKYLEINNKVRYCNHKSNCRYQSWEYV